MTAVEYLEESGVPESRWPNFRDWFNWFEKMKLVGVVKDSNEEICGVGMFRFIPAGADPGHYVHDEAGEDVFIDLVVCNELASPQKDGSSFLNNLGRRSDALSSLLAILLNNAGPRRRLIFNRKGKRKAYDYRHFMRKALI